jgi:hypothetical protein
LSKTVFDALDEEAAFVYLSVPGGICTTPEKQGCPGRHVPDVKGG